MKKIIFYIVPMLLFTIPTMGAQNLVVNGNMEVPVLPEVGFKTYWANETFGGWTVSSGSIDLVNCWQGAEGAQSLDLGGSPGPGTIYQDLSTIPQQEYILSFAMAGDPYRSGIKEMEVYWGDTLVEDLFFDTTGYTDQNMGWVYHFYKLTAFDATTRLKFVDINHTDGYYGSALDDVSVVQVPEPATLLLLGFGGLVLRRFDCAHRRLCSGQALLRNRKK